MPLTNFQKICRKLSRAEIDKWSQAQHEYLVFESVNAVEKFRNAGTKVYKVPADIEEALTADAAAFYEEKSASESPIFGKIYNSMKEFGLAYNAVH